MESNNYKNSKEPDDNAKRDSILYDLSVIDQEVILKNHLIEKKRWIKIPTKILDTGKSYINGIVNAVGLFKSFSSSGATALPVAYQNFLKEAQPHQILISEDGSALAISQLDTVQLRFDNDDFHMNQFQFKVPGALEQWQRFSLAFGGQWLALACGSELFLIFPPEAPRRVVLHGVPSISSIAALISRPSTIDPQCEELLMLDYQGMLLRIFISKTLKSEPVALAQKLVLPAYKKNETILNVENFHFVTTCMDYYHEKKLLAIGGGGELNNTSANASQISLWKLLDEEPYYELVFPSPAENIKPANKGWMSSARKAYQLSRQKVQPIVHKVCFSPNGDFLATLDLDGLVVIWDVDKRLRIKRWSSQALYNATNPPASKTNAQKGNNDSSIVRDIAWWDTNKLTVVGKGGWTIICGPVDEAEELKNLLGAQPEVFAPDTHVTAAIDGRFFISECVKETIQVTAEFDENDEDQGESDDEDKDGKQEKDSDKEKKEKKTEEKTKDSAAKDVSKSGSTLGWIVKSTINAIMPSSDDQSSWPLDKRVKDRFTFRLLSLSNTTPERLFISKIEAEEYGDALTLARIYNLNPDPVYQKRWATSPVTKHSIQDFLSKIKDLNWVLRECKERIPSTLQGARALLLYGLKITTPKSVVVEAESGSDEESEPAKKQQMTGENVKLSPEEVDLVYYRLVFLRYLDRLETYSAIISEPEFYNPKHYLHFRTCNLVNAAINFGFEEKFHAIDLLFTYHSAQTLPYRLVILHHIPETVDPRRYSDLLPTANETSDGEWETRKWREIDWSEHEHVLKQLEFDGHVTQVEDVLNGFDTRFKHNKTGVMKPVNYEAEYHDEIVRTEIKRWIIEGALRFPSQDIYAVPFETVQEMKLEVPLPDGVMAQYPESSQSLTIWYSAKSLLVEEKTGLVENALALVRLAIDNGVHGLETLRDDLEQLSMLVYECARDVKLKELDKLSPYERISLFLAESTEDSIIEDIQHRILPYIKNLKTTTPGIVMLGNWMVEASEKGKLALCTRVFQQSRPIGPEPPGGRIIENHNQLLRLALECMYACPQTGPSIWLQMNTIFECLPEPYNDAELEVQDLQDRVDLFEKHLSACERFTKYNQEKPVKFFLEVTKSQSDMLIKLLTKIASKGIKSQPALTDNEWRDILKDLLWLVDNIFTFIKRDKLYAIYLQSLLRAGKFKLAREYLNMAENTEHIVLEVASEYFNSCADPYQSEMNAAEDCLRLMTVPSIDVRRELDLIHAVKKLSSLGLKMLPVKIRLEPHKMNLIKKALTDRPESYSKRADLNEAAELLALRSKEELQMISLLEARAAFKKRDWTFASKVCKELIEAQYQPAWTVCKKIALTEEFKDLETRMQLLSFALCHCSKREIESLISYWRALENRQQCQQLGLTITDSEVKTLVHEIQSSRALDEQEHEVVSDDEDLIGDDELYEDAADQQDAGQAVKPSREMNLILANSSQFLHLCLKKLLELDSSDLMRNYAHDYSVPDRLVFHPFYAVNNAGYVAGEDLYSKFKAPANESLVFALKQALFKLSTITFSAQKSRAKATLDLAEKALHSDIQLFFAYLMSLERSETAKSLFDALIAYNGDNARASEFSTKLACYYYCLELLTHKSYIQDKLGFKLYNYAPNAAVEFVEHHMQKIESKMTKGTIGASSAMRTAAENETLASELLIHIKYYQDQLRDFSKVRELKSLAIDIDVTKFGMDEAYRQEMIRQMTHSENLDQFRTAVNLATRYHQPEPYKIIIEHLTWLLEHAKEFETIQYHMREYEHTLLDAPERLLEELKTIEAQVNGTNANSLTYLYYLLRETHLSLKTKHKVDNAREISHLDKVMELLGKWTKIIPKPDFKALQSSPDSASDTLTRVITEQNVFLIAKLLHNINELFAPPLTLTSSWLFKTLIHALLFKKNLSHEELQKRSAAATKYFDRLELSDLQEVIDGATIAASAVPLPLDIKLLVIGDAIQFVTQKEAQSDPNTPTKGKSRNKKKQTDASTLSYGSLLTHFERVHDHLLTVQSAASLFNGEFVHLLQDVDVSYFIHALWRAFNSNAKMNDTFLEMITNGIDLRVVHQLVVLLQQEQDWNDFPKKNKSPAEVDLTQRVLDLPVLVRMAIDNCLQALLSLPKDATVSLELDSYLNKKQQGHHGHWPISAQELDWALFYLDRILRTVEVALKIQIKKDDERPLEDEHRAELLTLMRDRVVLSTDPEINVNVKILLLKLLKTHPSIYGETAEDKTLFNHDTATAETLSSEFIVGTIFGKEIKAEKLDTIQSKRALFDELIQSLNVTDDKQFTQQIEQLLSLVLLWSQTAGDNSASELSAMWLAVLEPLMAKPALHAKIIDLVWRDSIDKFVQHAALVQFVGRHVGSLAAAALSTGLEEQIVITHLTAVPHPRVIALALRRGHVAHIAAKPNLWTRARLVLAALVAGDVTKMVRAKTDGDLWRDEQTLHELTRVIEDVSHTPQEAALSPQALVVQLIEGHLYLHAAVLMFVDMAQEIDPHFHTPDMGLRLLPQYLEAKVNQQVVDRNLRDDHSQHTVITWRECLVRCSKALVQLNNTLV